MTKIRYVHGDILTAPQKVVMQGCNLQKVMGSGLARFIRDKYPKVFVDYSAADLEMGAIIWSAQDTHERHLIGNAITQEFYGREPVRYVSYDAISKVVETLNEMAAAGDFGENPEIAFPLIGCGLANGKWSIVSAIIDTYSHDFQPVVYLIDGKIPNE